MTNSQLLLADGLVSEEIELSLRSLQTLLESLQEESGKKEARKPKGRENKTYAGVESFFYGDDDDEGVYDEDDEEDEEEYPVAENESQQKILEVAKKAAAKQEKKEDGDVIELKKINYESASASQKIASAFHRNNMDYPTDRALHSIVIENRAQGSVYDSLLDVSTAHNLKVEVEKYEGWGGGGLYIESINGVKNGQDDYFWEYIVNGKIPDVSVDKFQLHSGDLIEWRLLKKTEIKC